MTTSADIKHAAIRFFSQDLDSLTFSPIQALDFLANEQSFNAGLHDNWADGLNTALATIEERLGPSDIEIFGREPFRDQVVQVWLARAFCYFAIQIATKLEQRQALARPYCKLFDYAKGSIWDPNTALLNFCADVHYIAKQPLFQEQGWKCQEEELRRMQEKLYSYSWEEYMKTADMSNETGSVHTLEGSAWDGSNLSDTFMSMDRTHSDTIEPRTDSTRVSTMPSGCGHK